jgi:hypothetical protein
MKRWQEERHIMQRQSKVWVESLHRTDEFSGRFLKPLGKFRKRHPCGCGHPRCRLCHSEKIDGVKPHKVAVSDISIREQIAELGL